jgi:hypothetical protein
MRATQYPGIGAVPLRARVGEAHAFTSKYHADKRSDYKDDGTNILLDANENAYGPGLALNGEGKLASANVNGTSDSASSIGVDLLGLNRYPDPYDPSYLLSLLCD